MIVNGFNGFNGCQLAVFELPTSKVEVRVESLSAKSARHGKKHWLKMANIKSEMYARRYRICVLPKRVHFNFTESNTSTQSKTMLFVCVATKRSSRMSVHNSPQPKKIYVLCRYHGTQCINVLCTPLERIEDIEEVTLLTEESGRFSSTHGIAWRFLLIPKTEINSP